MPHLKGMGEWNHLSYASSLCGNCTEVCAVKINLHELLLHNRALSVQKDHSSFAERIAWKFWKGAMLKRRIMNIGTSKLKSWMVNSFVKDWKKGRSNLQFPAKSFNEMWQEQQKANS
jgi:L-lactate dehydrogenase complex protein LldF